MQIKFRILIFLFALQERQQFHLEQLRNAEFRARSAAQQQLSKEQLPPGAAAPPQQQQIMGAPAPAGASQIQMAPSPAQQPPPQPMNVQ